MLTAVLRVAVGSVRTASPAGARLAPSSSAGRSNRPPRRSRAKQGVFKNGSRRPVLRSRTAEGGREEADFGAKNTSAFATRLRLRFATTRSRRSQRRRRKSAALAALSRRRSGSARRWSASLPAATALATILELTLAAVDAGKNLSWPIRRQDTSVCRWICYRDAPP